MNCLTTRLALVFTLIIGTIATSTGANAVDRIEQMRLEIGEMRAAHDAKLNHDIAPVLMLEAMQSGGVGWAQRYSEPWGGWRYVDWSRLNGVYDNADHTLSSWDWAIRQGTVGEDEALRVLEPSFAALRALDAKVGPWFDEQLVHTINRARLLDLAYAAECCNATHQYWAAQAEHEANLAASIVDENFIGHLRLFPDVPEPGAAPVNPMDQQLDRLREELEASADQANPAARIELLRRARVLFIANPSDKARELVTTLELLIDRYRFAAAPVEELLNRIESEEPGPVRDALLREAQSAYMDRLATLAPVLASEAANGTADERQSTATKMLDYARRLTMFRDDLDEWSSPPSGLLKSLSALKTVTDLLDINENGNATASEMMTLINDAGTLVQTSWVAPTGGFSIPAGIATAQIDHTAKAWDEASTALDAVADVISGKPGAMERAKAASRRLQKLLSPRAYLSAIKDSLLPSYASNIPFLRALF